MVKNASHPVLGEHPLAPDRKRFAFQGWVDCNSLEAVMQVLSVPTTAQILRCNKQGISVNRWGELLRPTGHYTFRFCGQGVLFSVMQH